MSTEVLGGTNKILVCELNTGNLYICLFSYHIHIYAMKGFKKVK